MSKSISARDLLKIPVFAGKNEVFLITPANDKAVAPWLYALGIDTDFPVEIHANNHRDLDNNTGIGYRFVGSIRCDREYTRSPLCDIIERVAVTGFQDPSLTRELSEMMGQTVDFKTFNTGEVDEIGEEEYPISQIEVDYQETSNLINTLNGLTIVARGGTNVVDYSLDN